MAGNTRDQSQKMAEKYVEGRLLGKTKEQSAVDAGYSEKTRAYQIEQSKQVQNAMTKALEEKGITEEFLAAEYAEGISKSKEIGAKNSDFASHAKYLFQLGGLLGYGRKEAPAVAVQINTGASEASEPGRLEDLAGRLEGLLRALEEEVGSRDAKGVHEGDLGAGDSEAH